MSPTADKLVSEIEHQQALRRKLLDLFTVDTDFISKRDAHYESSWKKRGGIGAFMTICRPWDRFHAIAQRGGWDIFKIIQDEIAAGKTEADDGTLQACIRDIRAYMSLLAVEARQMRAATTPTPRDIPLHHTPLEERYGPNSVDAQTARDMSAGYNAVFSSPKEKPARDILLRHIPLRHIPFSESTPSRLKIQLSKLIEDRKQRDQQATTLGIERDNLDTLIQILFEAI